MRPTDIPGWTSPEELAWLADAGHYRPNIVEFGSWVGRSTKALTTHAQRVWACDHWAGDGHPNGIHAAALAGGLDVQAEFRRHLAPELGVGTLTPVTVDLRADDALRVIQTAMGGERASMVFIDANHVAPHPELDIRLAMNLVGPAAIIAGHDYDPRGWPDVVRAAEALFVKVHRGPHSIWWASVQDFRG